MTGMIGFIGVGYLAETMIRGLAAQGRAAGLLLSPHYVGPKLAAMMEGDDALVRGLTDGSLLFGTLDCFVVWRRSAGRRARTRCRRRELLPRARRLRGCRRRAGAP